MPAKLTYKQSGVNYDSLDSLKRMAQKAAKSTVKNLPPNITEISESRGESAYVLDIGDKYLAIVEEGLGTKTLVADAMHALTGKTYYDHIAQDTVATMVNDLITVGAKPISIMAYWSTGAALWFENTQRMKDLVDGWEQACHMSGVVWGGGETPTLTGIVEQNSIELAGAAVGIIEPKSRLSLGDKLVVGDAIVVFESSGIHADGLTLARKLAEHLPQGYKTPIAGGRMYGDALLDPTIIYAKLIQNLFDVGVDIHYMADITGHGWRKIMRHNKKFTYRISSLPPVPDVLTFLVEQAGLSDKEAFGTFNMGAGFAVFVPQEDVKNTLAIAKAHTIKVYDVGRVEKGDKQVILEPIHVTYARSSLQVRE